MSDSISLLDEIIEHHISENEYVVFSLPIGNGENARTVDLRFLILKDEAERNRLKSLSRDWVTEQREMNKRNILQGRMKDYFVDDLELLIQVFLLSKLCVNEDFQSPVVWMTMARKAGPLFGAIYENVNESVFKNRVQLMSVVMTQEKKDLKTQSTALE